MIIVDMAQRVLTDFTADIATKAYKYKKISEKQAYCLARSIIEFGGIDKLEAAAKEAL